MRTLVCLLALIAIVKCEIFHIQAADGRYRIPAVADARKLCESFNGRLATIEELEIAQIQGMDHCNCGFLEGDVVAFPLITPRPGCGNEPGIRYCPTAPSSWGQPGWDAYCVRVKTIACDNRYSFGPLALEYKGSPNDWAQMFTDIQFPADGKVAGWKYYSLRPDMTAYATVYRSVGSDRYQLVGRNRLPMGRVGQVEWIVDENYQIPVKKGDFIGIHYSSVLDYGGKMYTVIPYADESEPCSEDGTCVSAEDLSNTIVLHRHEEQLFYTRDQVLDVARIGDSAKRQARRAPAISPTMCAVDGAVLPTEATTLPPKTTSATEATTPKEDQTPEPPLVTETEATAPETEATEPETEATEPETEPTENVTETSEPETEATELETEATGPATEATEPETEATEPETEPTENVTETSEPETEATEPETEATRPPPTSTTRATVSTTESSREEVVTETGEFETGEEASRGVPCHFPFMYRKTLIRTCTMINSDRAWCATSDVYDGTHWRYCHEGDVTVEQLPCHIPFLYNGEKHSLCIKAGSSNYWCSTSEEYDPYTWRNCHDGDPIPDNLPCHYPFLFEGKEQNTCISTGAYKPWCSVEHEYNTENWRYCREGDKFPTEVPCHFPFEYQGKMVSTCISENANKPWCSTTAVYDGQNWRYCRQVEIFVLHGDKVRTAADAEEVCKESGLALAMERDITAAYENGSESCICGWTTGGQAFNVVREPREGCSPTGNPGVIECPYSEEGFVPICVKE